jgi:hypothetical protein
MLAMATALPAIGQGIMAKDFVGKKAPSIRAKKGHYFNSEEKPSLGKLRGNVVWLEFGFIH